MDGNWKRDDMIRKIQVHIVHYELFNYVQICDEMIWFSDRKKAIQNQYWWYFFFSQFATQYSNYTCKQFTVWEPVNIGSVARMIVSVCIHKMFQAQPDKYLRILCYSAGLHGL